MDCRVWQKAHRLYFLWPWRRASSSDDGPANEPSAEIVGWRGGAGSQEVRQGIFTTDEGSPHLEWHRRFGDGPDALGAREDRVYVEISTYCQKVRPNRNFSRLRYLTLLADIKERWRLVDLCHTAGICRVSTQATGKLASASALNSHCDSGPAPRPNPLEAVGWVLQNRQQCVRLARNLNFTND